MDVKNGGLLAPPTTKGKVTRKSLVMARKEGDQVFTQALQGLKKATSNQKTAVRVARNKDTIQELVTSLNTKPKFTKMVEYSVQCLQNLAVGATAVEEMIEEGVLEALQKVLKLNPYNEKIQQLINKTLEKLCVNDAIATKIASVMGPHGFVLSMKKHIETETLEGTCRLTARMLKVNNPDVTDNFVKAGLIGAVAHVLGTGKTKPTILAGGVECLDRVSENGKIEIATAIMQSGVLPTVINGLAEHTENAKLVLHSVGLIGNLANASPEIMEQLKKMGIVDILIAAIEMHPDNQEILEKARNALAPLSGADDMSASLQVVVGNNLATSRACSKLATLLLVPENVDYFVKNGGVEWLVSAVQGALGKQGDIPRSILLSGTRALQRVAIDEKKIYHMMRNGAVPLLVSVLKGHSEDLDVGVASLKALSAMLTRKQNAVFEMKNGAIEACLAVLRKHPDSDRTALAALEMFQKFAAHPECIEEMVGKGVIKTIADIMKKFKSNPQVMLSCLTTMGAIAITPALMRRICAENVIPPFVEFMEEYKSDRVICERVLSFLESAACLPELVPPIQEAGCVDVVLQVLEAQPELQDQGSRLLARIAGENQLKNAIAPIKALVDKLASDPSQAATIIPQLIPPVGLLGNLALVDRNIDFLFRGGAVDVLMAVVHGLLELPVATEGRNELLQSALTGIMRFYVSPEAQDAILRGSLADILKLAFASDNEMYAELAARLIRDGALKDPSTLPPLTIEQIIALAKAHPLNEKILAWAIEALSKLLVDEETYRRALAVQGEEVVVEAIFANMERPEVLYLALELLRHLAGVDENALKAVIDASAVDCVIEVLRKRPLDVSMHKACMATMSCFVLSAELAMFVVDKGLIPMLLHDMKKDPLCYDEQLCEWDILLCDSLVSVEQIIPKFVNEDPYYLTYAGSEESDAYKLVSWVKNKYVANEAIQEAAPRILAALRGEPPAPEPVAPEPVALEPVPEPVPEVVVPQESPEEIKARELRELRAGRLALNEERAGVLLDDLKGDEADPLDAKQERLRVLRQLIADSANARIMLDRGALQSLSAAMKENPDEEKIFYPASNAFLRLLEMGGEITEQMLEDPACLEALCMMLSASERLASAMEITQLTRAVQALSKRKLKPGQVKQIMASNPLPNLFKMMIHSDEAPLLISAAQLLAKLSNDPEASALLAQLASIRALIQAMRRNYSLQDFLQYGLYLLGNLGQHEALRAEIGAEGGIQLMVQIMESYPNNSALVDSACFGLAQCTYDSFANCNFVIACKGFELLIPAMKRWTKETSLLDSAIVTVINVCHHSEASKGRAVALDAAPTIVDCALNNFHHPDLQISCFRALGSLASDKKLNLPILEAGAAQCIVAGMTAHNDDLPVLAVAIRVLTNLSVDPGEKGMQLLHQEGVVQAVVEVCLEHKTELELQTSALGCLNNLCAAKFNAELIINQGGLAAVNESLEALNYAPALSDRAARFYLVLSHHQDFVDRMLSEKVHMVLLNMLRAHSKSKLLVSRGLQTLANLAYTDRAAQTVAQHCLGLALSLTKTYLTDETVLPDCMRCLSNLCRHEDNAIDMSDKALELVEPAFAAHITRPKVIGSVFQFLANLFTTPETQEKVLTTPILGVVLTSLSTQKEPLVVSRGFTAIRNIACGDGIVKEFCKKEGVIITTKEMRTQFHEHNEVVKVCDEVIFALDQIDVALFYDGPMSMAISKPVKHEVKSAEELEPERKLDEAVRNMVQSGALMVKHSKTAPPREKHIYVDTQLKYLIWRDLHEHKPDPKSMIKITTIKTVDKGLTTKALLRTRFGKPVAEADHCLSVMAKGDRFLSVELPSELEREKWAHALETLVTFCKTARTAVKII